VSVPAAFVEEVIRQLEAQLGDKKKELEYANLKIQSLEQCLRQILIKKYGAASEKLSSAQLELLELEPGVSSDEVQAESEREPLTAPPAAPEEQTTSTSGNRQKHPGRQSLPAHLAGIEKIVACTPEQSKCGVCGKDTVVIGYQESEQLDVEPAKCCPRALQARPLTTRWHCAANSRDSSNSLSWSYRTIWPRTPCGPSRSVARTGSTWAVLRLDRRLLRSFPSWKAAAGLACSIRIYLAAVLPGLANRSIKSLDQLTPAAQAARN